MQDICGDRIDVFTSTQAQTQRRSNFILQKFGRTHIFFSISGLGHDSDDLLSPGRYRAFRGPYGT